MGKVSVTQAVTQLTQGGLIAYPTEAVFGIGCDPFNEQAVQAILAIKQRPVEKGVILVAANIEQVQDLVRLHNEPWTEQVLASWPGPYTWVLPVKTQLPMWVTGGRDTLAIRVSAHPLVQALCQAFAGPIVSTSANPTSLEPARSCQEVYQYFADEIPCLAGELGGLDKPTEIRDAQTGQCLRL